MAAIRRGIQQLAKEEFPREQHSPANQGHALVGGSLKASPLLNFSPMFTNAGHKNILQ